MPSPQHFLQYLYAFLSKPGVYGSVPLSLLLIGLAVFIERKLLCPCRYGQNVWLILFIFVAPACFTFTLMYAWLRLKSTGNKKAEDTLHATGRNENVDARSSAGKKDTDDTQPMNLGEIVLYCLIPPVIWILILLIDGDYVACGMTTWEGNYVFDKEINIKWCQPTEQHNAGNRSIKYKKIIWESQLAGYVLILILSVLIFIVIVCRDCHNKTAGAQDGKQTRTQTGEGSETRSQAEGEEMV